jgi:hypothetical protein
MHAPSRAEEDRRMLKDLSEKAEELCRKYDVASRQGQSSSRSFLMDLRHLMEGMCEPKDVLELCAVEIEKSSPFDSNVEIAKRIRGMRDFLFCEIRDENHCTFHHCEPSYTCGESDCPHCKGE